MLDLRTASRLAWSLAALTVAKYARASIAPTRLSQANGPLTFEVTDDGLGFGLDAAWHGSGLQGIADRLPSLGGEFVLRAEPGRGTTIRGTVAVGVGP